MRTLHEICKPLQIHKKVLNTNTPAQYQWSCRDALFLYRLDHVAEFSNLDISSERQVVP